MGKQRKAAVAVLRMAIGLGPLAAMHMSVPEEASICRRLLVRNVPIGCACYTGRLGVRILDQASRFYGYREIFKAITGNTVLEGLSEKEFDPHEETLPALDKSTK